MYFVSPSLRVRFCALIALMGSGPLASSVTAQVYDTTASVNISGSTVVRNVSAFVPEDVAEADLRGVLFWSNGSGEDRRYMARVPWVQSFARTQRIAVVATNTSPFESSDAQRTGSNLSAILSAVATASGRSSLVNAPALATGMSFGGIHSSTLAAQFPSRVLGFAANKGLYGTSLITGFDTANAANVPGLAMPGEDDGNGTANAFNVQTSFSEWRALSSGAGRIAFALDYNVGHNDAAGQSWDLALLYLSETARLRHPGTALSAGQPALLAVPYANGWLAERAVVSSGAPSPLTARPVWPQIAPVASYTGSPAAASASWLPSERAARAYRAFTSTDATDVNRTEIPKNNWLQIETPARLQQYIAGDDVVVTVDPRELGAVSSMTLYLDGTAVSTLTVAPWRWTLPAAAAGLRSVVVEATTAQGAQRAAFATFTVQELAATANTWTGGGASSNLGTAANWSAGAPADLKFPRVRLDGAAANGQLTVGNGSASDNPWFRGIEFASAPGDNGFTFTGWRWTYLGSGGIRNLDDSTQTFSQTGDIRLYAPQTWAAIGGDLVFAPAVTLGNPDVAEIGRFGDLTLRAANGRTITLNGEVKGLGSLVKEGAGLAVLNAANTFADNKYGWDGAVRETVRVHEGTLRLGSSAALAKDSARIHIAETATATLDLAGRSVTAASLHGGGTLALGAGGSLTLQAKFEEGAQASLAATDFRGAITGGTSGQTSLSLRGGYSFYDSDGVGGAPTGGTLNPILSGASSYLGQTLQVDGALRIGSSSALGATGAGNETVISSGAQAWVVGGGLSIPEDFVFNTAGNAVAISNAAGSGSNTLSGALRLPTVESAAANVDALVLNESAGTTLTLSGTLTGQAWTSAGTGKTRAFLRGASNAAFDVTGVIANPSGGVLDLFLQKQGSTPTNPVFRLAGANTFTGSVFHLGGTLRLAADAPSGSAGALGAGTGSVTLGASWGTTTDENLAVLTEGARNVARSFSVATISGATGSITFGSADAASSTWGGAISSPRALTLTAPSGGSATFTGVVSGAASVTKTGAGTVTLSAANTYSGGTSVSAGTLWVNNTSGSGTGTGAVTVASGGVLGGTGTISGNVAVQNGGTLLSSIGTAPGAHAGLAIQGALTLSSGSGLVVSVPAGGAPATGTYTLLTASGGITGSASSVQLPAGWSGSATISGNSLQLVVTSLSPAASTLIAYEPFDYRARLALPTLSGGAGFTGPWQMVSSRDVTNPDGGTIGGGRAGGIGEGDLPVAGLASTGNRYRNWVWTDTEASGVMQWRQLSTSYDNSMAGASDLWVSYVVTVNGSAPTSSQYFEVNFHQINTTTPNPYIQTATNDADRTTTLRIGKLSGRSGWSWAWTRFAGDSGAANTPAANTRYFVVAKVSPKSGGGSTISLWVNPAIGATAPSSGDLATGISDRNSAYPVKFNAIGLAHDKSIQIDLDEIRVGATWADVCPTASTGRLVVTGNGERLVSGATAQLKNHSDFGSATVGSGSVVRTFTLTNEGSAALGSLSASVGGGAGFSVTSAPATSLAATVAGSASPASSTVSVTFAPSLAGPASDTLTLSYTGGPSFTVPISGFGTPVGASLSLSRPVSYRVFQRDASGLATVPVAGSYTGTVSKIQYRTRLHAGAAGIATDWTDLVASPSGGAFAANLSLPAGGWYYLDVRALNGATEVARSTVDRVGSGEVFVVSGQSNSANAGAYPNGAPDDRVATIDWTLADNANGGVAFIRVTNGGSGYTSAPAVSFSGSGGATATAVVSGGVVTGVTVTNAGSGYQSGPTVTFSGGGGTGAAATAFLYPSSDSANWPQTLAWRRGDSPLGPSDGPRGSVWPVLGGKLVETLGVPVAFLSVGKGGMPIEAWRDGDGRQLLWPLLNALNYVGSGGARAVLWHQGESNGHMTTAGSYYNEINTLIARSRSSGWAVDWVVAQASILGDAVTNAAVVGDQARIANDLAYVHPGPNTDQMLNAAGSDPLYRNNPGVRWDNIHFNPKGLEMHAAAWVTKLNAAYSLTSVLSSAPPAWSAGYPKADGATLSGFTLRARANESGVAYYVLLASGAAAPSAAQVKAGQNASGAAALRSGSITLSAANTEYSAVLTGLGQGTSYVAYFVAEDGDGNLQSSPVAVAISTLAPDTTAPIWTGGWPKADSAGTEGFTVRARTNEAGTAYYVVVADGATAPGAAQVKAGQNASGAAALKSGSLVLSADVEAGAVVSGLSSGTAYDVYVVAQDAAETPNLQSVPVKLDVSTVAPSTGLIAYEGFSYTAGTALGAATNGGGGWASGWSVVSGSAPTVDASSLAVGTLQTGGGSVTQSGAATVNSVTRDLSAVLGGGVTSASPLTLWLSFVHKGNASDSSDSYLSFYRDGGTSDAIMVGRSTGASGFRVNSALGGTTTGSSLPFDGTTRFILVRLDLTRNTTGTGTNVYTARMWGYTTPPTSEPAVDTENQKIVSGTAGLGTGIKGIRLYDNTSGSNSQFDEIRLGENFGAVVPVADTSAPSNVSGWPKADGATTGGFTVRARINEAGTAYYVVVADGAAAPSAAQVKAGQNASGATALASGSFSLAANTEGSATVTGLASSTAYDVYVVAQDAASTPNLQASAIKVDVTTASTLLESWRQTHFGTTSAVGEAADAADPDADGAANLLEYALGTDPLDEAAFALPQAVVASSRLTLRFTPAVVTGLVYEVLAGADLATWDATDVSAQLTAGQPYTFTDGVDLSAASPRRFLRLRVSR